MKTKWRHLSGKFLLLLCTLFVSTSLASSQNTVPESNISELRVWQDYSEFSLIHVDWKDTVADGEYDISVRANTIDDGWQIYTEPIRITGATEWSFNTWIPNAEYHVSVSSPTTGQKLKAVVIAESPNYTNFGTKSLAGHLVWVDKKEIEAGKCSWDVKNISYTAMNVDDFVQKLQSYNLYYVSEFRYTEESPSHGVNDKIVIRAPSGQVSMNSYRSHVDGQNAGWAWAWYSDLYWLKHVISEPGEYTIEHFFDSQLVNRSTFVITN